MSNNPLMTLFLPKMVNNYHKTIIDRLLVFWFKVIDFYHVEFL